MRRAAPWFVVALVLALTQTAVGLDHVTLHLKWLHGAQFAGVYAAEMTGLFERADLDVELIAGAATDDVIREVVDGTYDFILADPTSLLVLASEGASLVAVAAIYQIDPVVIISLPESGIRRPEDLLGKRIMSFTSSHVIPAILGRVGLETSDVELGPPSYDLEELYAGTYDAWTGYMPNEVRRARAEGHDVQIIFPTDYGVHLYGDVLITRADLITSNPDLVQRVVSAIIGGWAWVLDHVDEAAALSLGWDPRLDPAEEREILLLSLPFIHAGDVQLGGMADNRWRSMVDAMTEYGLLPSGLDMSHAYTLRFVDGTEEDGP